MGIAENISAIKATLLDGVRLIAVSKFHPTEAIAEAYEAGQRDSAKAVCRNSQPRLQFSPTTYTGTS